LIPLNKGLFPNQNSSRAELVVINMMEKIRSVTFDKRISLSDARSQIQIEIKGLKARIAPKQVIIPQINGLQLCQIGYDMF